MDSHCSFYRNCDRPGAKYPLVCRAAIARLKPAYGLPWTIECYSRRVLSTVIGLSSECPDRLTAKVVHLRRAYRQLEP